MLPDGLNTYAGLVVVILGTVLHLFGGYHIVSENYQSLVSDVANILTLLGTGYATWGRYRLKFPSYFSKDTPTA